jgi:hypothetical protein
MDPNDVDCADRTMLSPEQAKLLVQIYGFVYVNIIYYFYFYYIIISITLYNTPYYNLTHNMQGIKHRKSTSQLLHCFYISLYYLIIHWAMLCIMRTCEQIDDVKPLLAMGHKCIGLHF